MATRLKDFDFQKQSELTISDKATYPWDEWLDGDIWELTWKDADGEDFETHPLMMERIIRTRATGRKAKVRLRHVGVNGHQWGKIVVQRTDVKGPNEVKKAERAAKRAATKATKNGTKPAKAVAKKAPVKKAVPSKRAARKVAVPA